MTSINGVRYYARVMVYLSQSIGGLEYYEEK